MNENRSQDVGQAEVILLLDELTRSDQRRAGSKAVNLGELARAGFPVPTGFVLTTDAFDRFIAGNSLNQDSPIETVEAAPMPVDLKAVLHHVASLLNGVAVAVRSSGVAEDLSDASFAGQYETVLNVRGADALVEAVRHCWASAFSQRVAAYRSARKDGSAGSMAVLIQHMVLADAAGVAFTANPVTGNRMETVVSAVRGLGERLVSGQASPDEWVVRDGEAVLMAAPEDAISSDQAKAIAGVARRVEAHFGTPQDVEWAMAGGELFLLQARPITALPNQGVEPIPVPVEPPPGFWERESSHFPDPVSPMLRSAVLPVHEAAFKLMVAEFSLLLEGAEFREIGGWLYQRIVPLGGKERPAPPSWLMPLLIRLVPEMRRHIKGMVDVVRSDKVGSLLERWYSEWKPNAIARAAELREVDLKTLSEVALEEHLSRVIAFVHENLNIHAMVSALDSLVAELALASRDLLGWDGRRAVELLSGLSDRTSEPSRRLAGLARNAQSRPAVLNLLDRIDHHTAGRLAEVDEEFHAAFNAYLRQFGCRTLRFELNETTLEESPELVLRLIHDQVTHSYNPDADAAALEQKRAAALAEARGMLAKRSPEDRERFERVLSRAERAYPIREDHEFYVTNTPLALLRYAILEVGRRLTERGQIDQRDDILFLEIEEARSALQGGDRQQSLVDHRKGELAWTRSHPGPAYYGTPPGPPPSLAAFPPEARSLMEALMWMLEGQFATQFSQQAKTTSSGVLQGLAASPGQYTGPVRVIMKEAEFSKLQAGDVMVCPTTQPAWSVLFPSVGALVTDSGGILSHPAIIAREYRVPAVVATGNATSTLRDGQTVSVDGGSGLVKLLT